MKVRRGLKEHISAKSCSEIILSIWRELGSPAVGESELTRLRQALSEVLGPDEVPGPARIARELAQEGAALRHPEIIESDARWRSAQIAGRMGAFENLRLLQTGAALEFDEAAASLTELEALRGRFENAGDDAALTEVKRLAIEAREAATKRAGDSSLSPARREMQAEIAQWFRVWLETPGLFTQWLDLRRSSAAFKDKFSSCD